MPEQRPEARLENGQIVVRENDDVHGIRRALQSRAAEANGREAGQRGRARDPPRQGRPGPPEDAPPASPPFSLHHALRSFQKKLISIAAMRARACESSARVFSSSSRSSSNGGSLTGTGSR